ncbi:1-deoxypentalenic acid 11-beta-hydroxylase [Aplysia californica]|uniref:1-deoxypentalenic acid 11-beta-hydroxylase n=1 Tax=Aplysia californica TaxID=6500 RepID=A0ABM0K9E6_APLCA|nr:1-deoxypentalenic acid 11-beta-hydroxylase [Aplysia californica]
MAADDTGRTVKLGRRAVQFPSAELQVLEDCNHLLGDLAALKRELQEKGYLFIRGFHDQEEVLAARQAVLEHIDSFGSTLNKQHPIREGVLRDGCGLGCVPLMEGKNDITHSELVLRVLEGKRPLKFFREFFKDEVKTFDYKWLRAMHHEGFTGVHVDNVYMSRGSADLLTLWTPMGDVTVEMGVLAVCEGSHRLPGFQKFQEKYGNMDAEKENLQGTGWFTEDPYEITSKFGGQWKTVDFSAGDVLIFGMRTAHMSTTNTTHLARISCDTRWQPASEPVDPRFCGLIRVSDSKFGLLSKMTKEEKEEDRLRKERNTVSIEQLKAVWGL